MSGPAGPKPKRSVTFDNTPKLVLIVGDEKDEYTFNNDNRDGTPRVSQTDVMRRRVKGTYSRLCRFET